MMNLRPPLFSAFLPLTMLLLVSASGCRDAITSATSVCAADTGLQLTSQPVIYGAATWVAPDTASQSISAAAVEAMAAEVAILREGSQAGANGEPLVNSALLCEDEVLADEVALAKCSGMLIAPNLMVTARHCTEVISCAEMRITADFDTTLPPNKPWAFDTRRCVRVLATDPILDTAIVELAPPSNKTRPAAGIRLQPITDTTPAILISHPLGTSTKVDLEAFVRPSARGPESMWFRGDAFQGSSGGGLIDVDGKLIGVVTAGLADLRYDREAGCMRLNRSNSEGFERLSSVKPLLAEACKIIPQHAVCNKTFAPTPIRPAQPNPNQLEPIASKPEKPDPAQPPHIGCFR